MTRSMLMTCAMATVMTVAPNLPGVGTAGGTFSVSEARADNGDARRAARRTARRVVRRNERYYNTLPAGCIRVFRGGVSYFQCGTIYYQPAVHQGVEVYVIVTP